MNILVIGSEGFIGKNLVNFFTNNNVVIGIDSTITSKNSSNYKYIRVLSLNYNLEDLIGSFVPDVLIFAGGSANVQLSIEQPNLDFEANVTSVSMLLESIKKININCKFIHFSSAAVYGNPQSLPVSEDHLTMPVSPYGWHKLQAELMCKEYNTCFGLQTCSLRPFSVYGPGQKKLLLWDLYQKAIISKGNIELFGTGSETRDFIYIDDLVSAVALIIEKGEFNGDVYNIGSGLETRIADLSSLFIEKLNLSKKILFNGIKREGDPIHWRADVDKLKILGFNTVVNFEVGLTIYSQWLKEKQ